MRRPLAALFAAVVAWLGAAAFAGPGDSAMPPCRPAEDALAAGATLAGAAGTYRLTLVGRSPDGGRRAASGSLRLWPSALKAFAPATNPLRGATDLKLRAVGAVPVGDPGSENPAAPGVLVLESLQDGAPRILLRLGSHANRPGEALFDGGHTVLEVREIGASGFAGEWRSGVDAKRASGHFCAWRSGDGAA